MADMLVDSGYNTPGPRLLAQLMQLLDLHHK